MSLPIRTLLDQRASELARQFHRTFVPPLVQAQNLRQMIKLHSHGGGTIAELPESKGLVWSKTTNHTSSIWVRADDGNYRDTFRKFIDATYDAVDWTDFAQFDVDHLYNKANAMPTDWLRIEGIAGGINKSHGASFERRNTGSTIEIANRASSEQGLMTFVVLMKIAGLKAPRKISDTQRMAPISAYFQSNGWPKKEIDDAVGALLEKSRWRR